MKLLKKIFGHKSTIKSKNAPNTLAEMNGSPDLRLMTPAQSYVDMPVSSPKSGSKAKKKAPAKNTNKVDTDVVKIEKSPDTEQKSKTKNAKTNSMDKAKNVSKRSESVEKSTTVEPVAKKNSTIKSTATATDKKKESVASHTKKSAPTVVKSPAPTTAKKPASIATATKKDTAKQILIEENTDAVASKSSRTGKFEIKKSKDGRFVFNLYASNNVIVATSQIYASSTSAMNGIKSVIANASSAPVEDQTLKSYTPLTYPKWEIYLDKGEQYRFRLCASNGSCVCHSQGYTSKSNCKKGIESIIKFASDAEISKAYLEKKEK